MAVKIRDSLRGGTAFRAMKAKATVIKRDVYLIYIGTSNAWLGMGEKRT
jgi:hypothetical protein